MSDRKAKHTRSRVRFSVRVMNRPELPKICTFDVHTEKPSDRLSSRSFLNLNLFSHYNNFYQSTLDTFRLLELYEQWLQAERCFRSLVETNPISFSSPSQTPF